MAPRKPPTKKAPPRKPAKAKVSNNGRKNGKTAVTFSAESLSDQVIDLIEKQFESLKGADRMYYIHRVQDHVNNCHVIARLETEERAKAHGMTPAPVPVEGDNTVTVPGGGAPVQSDPPPCVHEPTPTCAPDAVPITPAEVTITTP